jgi:hypothetical protein
VSATRDSAYPRPGAAAQPARAGRDISDPFRGSRMTPSSVLNHSYGFRRNRLHRAHRHLHCGGDAGLWLGAPQRAFLSEGEWNPGCSTTAPPARRYTPAPSAPRRQRRSTTAACPSTPDSRRGSPELHRLGRGSDREMTRRRGRRRARLPPFYPVPGRPRHDRDGLARVAGFTG